MSLISISSQIHGYQQGHQLLASSVKLTKKDQSIIDRLSDVAGPLRPAEKFEPYLSAYPLPSGENFVLARTWQDLTVARAGCVRTLSLLIPMDAWATSQGLMPFFNLLDSATPPTAALTVTLSDPEPAPLPPVPDFRASELLEALFLEEAKPVAVFDAPTPELAAIRLLTALWPAMRQGFSLSTLALSPRNIDGRSFNLVFAPKDARSRFADWGGRRVDARGGKEARHRWTGSIVNRVFHAPLPWLLDEDELRLIDKGEADNPAALRIALLWDELIAKVEQSPSAALGLLDIVNSRKRGDPDTMRGLEPILANAARRAVTTMSATEAWDFLGALVRKIHRTPSSGALPTVATAASELASLSPEGGIRLLTQPDPQSAIATLMAPIAEGIAWNFDHRAEQALIDAEPNVIVNLIAVGGGLAKAMSKNSIMIEFLADVLPQLPASDIARIAQTLLPNLLDDSQLALAKPILALLDPPDFFDAVRRLSDVNDFAAKSFIPPLVKRARELNQIEALTELLLSVPPSVGRDQFLAETFSAEPEDVGRLLRENDLPEEFVKRHLATLLRNATAKQLTGLFGNDVVATQILDCLTVEPLDVLRRLYNEVESSAAVRLAITLRLLIESSEKDRLPLAESALAYCLRWHFGGDEKATILMLLAIIGGQFDARAAARHGLDKKLSTRILSRNLEIFQSAPEPARANLVRAIDDISRVLAENYSLDLEAQAARDCAKLFLDSQSATEGMFLTAAGRILPVLLRSISSPVSPLIAATFPSIYRELAKEDEGPDFLRFIPFMDWDRCKSARRELTDAFLKSKVWDPADLALAAIRSGDQLKILRKIAKSQGGEAYFERLNAAVKELPEPSAKVARQTLGEIIADWPSKYDWKD
jgi:hypothetical protein